MRAIRARCTCGKEIVTTFKPTPRMRKAVQSGTDHAVLEHAKKCRGKVTVTEEPWPAAEAS